jgi:hypothetical protein
MKLAEEAGMRRIILPVVPSSVKILHTTSASILLTIQHLRYSLEKKREITNRSLK